MTLRLGATAGCLLLSSLFFAGGAEARVSCTYAPLSKTLTVEVNRGLGAEISRHGSEILVNEFLGRPTTCAGGVPTVFNTDAINVFDSDTLTSSDVLLEGGPLAPGATPEPTGAAEIEIHFRGRDLIGGVTGTPRADVLHWGPGGDSPGLNFNPGVAGDQDVDVTVRRTDGSLVADGAGGNDVIVAAAGTAITGQTFSQGGRGDDRLVAPPNAVSVLRGGPGNDVLTAGTRGDLALGGAGNDMLLGGPLDDAMSGGAGNDRVDGAGGPDQIVGGPGRDLLLGGRGRDAIMSKDKRRDRVRCGPGRDRVRADRRDRLRRCERVSRRSSGRGFGDLLEDIDASSPF